MSRKKSCRWAAIPATSSSPAGVSSTVVELTAAGTELVDEIARRRRDFFRDVLRALEPGEREELVRLTARAAGALRSTTEELIRR